MIRRLPPLNALRAFEAAARHLSVKRAATELCVTPGAVSQMLKTLEQHLGVQLFQRLNRGIALTAAGQELLPPVRNALTQIADAARRVAGSGDSGTLTVSCTPLFATAWLVPRLQDFCERHPGIDVRLLTGNALTDFVRDGVDAAVRHGLGRYPGLHSERVVALQTVPVAAPALVERLGRPGGPAELARWPHVHDAARQDWHLWFQAQGIHESGAPRGPSFDDLALLLNAVRAGQGAGLVPLAAAALDLEQGRLVRLAATPPPQAFAYYLVYPEAYHGQPKIVAFRRWLLGVAATATRTPAPLTPVH